MPPVTEENLFPYDQFPVRLQLGEKKNTTICWFECEEHLQKYLKRHKIDKRKVKIDYNEEKTQNSVETVELRTRRKTRKK